MKPGVYYLYEYKNDQKSRNIGFLKLSKQSDFFSLQLCARGISVFQNDAASLFALFFSDKHFCACPVKSISCENHAITCRLEIPIQSLSKTHPLDQLTGFLLELPGGSCIAATDESSHFTPAQLVTSAESSVSNSDSESESIDEPAPDSMINTFPEPDSRPTRSRADFQKLSRNELSVLPRQYWYLANNSFLLHGYYNYNHLLLIEEDGHFLLGVPGICDKQEARAAELFGFPSFSESYADQLQLSEQEMNMPTIFGHWFREIPK